MSTYFELLIKINPQIEDVLSEICFENLPCEGVILAEEVYKDLEMISTTEGTLKVFLTEKPEDVVAVLDEQRELLKSRGFTDDELGSWEFTLEEKENQDWSQKWKEKWDITRVTDRIVVVPDWIEYEPKADEVVIRLEPGCAFGTGTHATTQLCMRAVENFMKKGDTVADIGTGSGILAICASKFGAKSVYGCDNDDTVIDVARENALKNGLSIFPRPLREREEFLGEQSEFRNSGEGYFEFNTADKITEKFDFVMANILHNVLAEIMSDLKNLLKPEGKLVLSGILDEKREVVLDAVKRCDLEVISEDHIDQWVSFTVKRG